MILYENKNQNKKLKYMTIIQNDHCLLLSYTIFNTEIKSLPNSYSLFNRLIRYGKQYKH